MNDLKIYAGNSVSIGLIFTDEKNRAIDISGKTLVFTVKYNKYDNDDKALIMQTTTIPTNTDTVNGTTAITLTVDDNVLTPGSYVYDITLKTTSPDTVMTICVGKIDVEETVTKGY